MSFSVEENIGPYQIIKQIGQGGMGTVFKAYHQALDRYVALKILHPVFHEDRNFTARFQREARLVAKLEHANIVPIYDYAEHAGRPYLVMKFVEGRTLRSRLNQGPLSFHEIVQVVDSLGLALAYAHKQGILHRDIKPSNVLIGENGTIYLADFGLARITADSTSTLSSDSILGTPQYISPEQAMGHKDLDERTDVYSFGVMLYEILTGQPPFDADTPLAIVHDHVYSPVPEPHTLNPNISRQVEYVLLKALAKDPNDRYENVTQFVIAFKNAWLKTDTSTEFDLPVADKQAKKQKKRSLGWLYTAAGIILLTVIIFGSMPSLRRNLVSALTSTDTPVTILSSSPSPTAQTATSQVTTVTPAPKSTNTTEPSNQSTAPAPNVIDSVQTEVNNVDIPKLLP